ncbi:hypothetical protein EJB05_09207, partial [Eragrostis curvula]
DAAAPAVTASGPAPSLSLSPVSLSGPPPSPNKQRKERKRKKSCPEGEGKKHEVRERGGARGIEIRASEQGERDESGAPALTLVLPPPLRSLAGGTLADDAGSPYGGPALLCLRAAPSFAGGGRARLGVAESGRLIWWAVTAE